MKRFSNLLHNDISLSLLFSLTVLILLGGITWMGYRSQDRMSAIQNGRERTQSLRIELLHARHGEGAPELGRINRQLVELDTLVETYTTSARARASDPTLRRLQRGVQDLDSETMGAVVGLLVRWEAALHQEYRATRDRLLRQTAGGFFLQLVLVVGVVCTLLSLRRQNRRFLQTIMDGVRRMDDVARFRSAPQELPVARWEEEQRFLESIEKVVTRLAMDRDLTEIPSQGSLEEVVAELFKTVSGLVPCDRLALAFIDPLGNVTAESAYTVMDSIFLDPGFTEPISDTTLQAVADGGRPRIINDLEYHYRYVHASRSTESIIREGLRASITVPLSLQDDCVGFLFVASRHVGAFSTKHAEFVARTSRVLKEKLYYSYLVQQLIARTAEGFVTLAQTKDNETSEHIRRMSRYSYLIAKQAFSAGSDLTPRKTREILWFAPLHDIGKIGIPDAVLNKPDQLDDREWEIMKSHVTIGESVIAAMNDGLAGTVAPGLLETALEIVATHHERWDGSGYPRGLAGEEIPLAGRIVAVADVFDALTSARPYKEEFSVERTLEIMGADRGRHFDPAVYDSFIAALPGILAVREEVLPV